MASIVTIKIGYNDNSHSYTECFNCADTHPSAEVIAQLEADMRNKYWNMNHRGNAITLHTTVKQAN